MTTNSIETRQHTHGGKRPGSGRKKGEPTKTVGFRIKVKNLPELKNRIHELIDEFELEKTQ